MSTPPVARTGFFIIADICGYTSFLTSAESEHAQAIVEELTKLLLLHIKLPLKLVKLEGDAIFYYAPSEMMPEAERLLDHIESCYFDFINRIRYAQRANTCTCRACSSMHTLDLKFFVHYGEYLIQKLPGTSEDIVGRDIILLHRLLKNSVGEKTGMRGYVLITNACLPYMGALHSIVPHSETYEYIGEVSCGLYDLHVAEESMRETKRVLVKAEEADYVFERVLNATPALLWSFIVDPKRRVEWQKIKTVENIRNRFGRLGIDAEFHCDHGAFNRDTRMLDWRPFHYMTNSTVQYYHMFPIKPPPAITTFELIPIDDRRTRISMRVRMTQRSWLMMQIFRIFIKPAFNKEYEFEYNKLENILAKMANDNGSGKLKSS